MKITVPTSLADITVKQYMKYEKAETAEDKMCALLDLDVETYRRIEKPSISQIETLMDAIYKHGDTEYPLQPIVAVNGLKMGLVPDLHRISLGEFVDLEVLCKDPFPNLPRIISILYRRVETETSYSEYSVAPYTGDESTEWAEDMKMDAVMGMLGFFLTIGLEFSRASVQSLKELTREQVR